MPSSLQPAIIGALWPKWRIVAKDDELWLAIMKFEAPAEALDDYYSLQQAQQEIQGAGETSIGSTSSICSFFAAWSVSSKIRNGGGNDIKESTEAKRVAWVRKFKLRLKGSHLVFSFDFYGKKEEDEERKWSPIKQQVIVPLDEDEELYRFFDKGSKVDPDGIDARLFELRNGAPKMRKLSERLCMRMEMYIVDAQRGGKITHLLLEPEFVEAKDKTRVGQVACKFIHQMPRRWCRHLFALAQEASMDQRVMGGRGAPCLEACPQ